MQVNQPQGGAAEATTPSFQLGDKVSYVISSGNGRSIRFSAREGTIVGLDDRVALIKLRNGRTSMQPLNKLTPAGQPNALTKALLGEA